MPCTVRNKINTVCQRMVRTIEKNNIDSTTVLSLNNFVSINEKKKKKTTIKFCRTTKYPK